MSKPESVVGIDVAKQHLDVAIAGEDTVWRVSHDAAGLTELCARLAAAAPAQIVMEATGGLPHPPVPGARGTPGLYTNRHAVSCFTAQLCGIPLSKSEPPPQFRDQAPRKVADLSEGKFLAFPLRAGAYICWNNLWRSLLVLAALPAPGLSDRLS